MPRALTPFQAARILAQFDKNREAATEAGLTRGLNYAKRLAVTKYMQGLGSGKNARPANAPPGPIGIRSGKLRRSIRVIAPERTKAGWTGGLAAGGDDVPYARIQELGGRTRAHVIVPRNKRALSWKVGVMGPVRSTSAKVRARGASNTVFAQRVNHPGSNIPARPYIGPAMEEATPAIIQAVDDEHARLISRLFGD